MTELSYKSKTILIGFMLVLIFYFLIAGIFGPRGFIYNNSIGKKIAVLMSEEQNLNDEIERLKKISDYLDTPEGKEKVASQLGYYFSDNFVYIYSASSMQTENGNYEYAREINSTDFYNPISNLTCFIIALLPSIIISMLYFFIMRNRKTEISDYSDKTGMDISKI